MPEMHARQGFDFQRLHGRQLCLGKTAHLSNRKFAVASGLRIEFTQRGFNLLRRYFKLLRHHFVELLRKSPERAVTLTFHALNNRAHFIRQ